MKNVCIQLFFSLFLFNLQVHRGTENWYNDVPTVCQVQRRIWVYRNTPTLTPAIGKNKCPCICTKDLQSIEDSTKDRGTERTAVVCCGSQPQVHTGTKRDLELAPGIKLTHWDGGAVSMPGSSTTKYLPPRHVTNSVTNVSVFLN